MEHPHYSFTSFLKFTAVLATVVATLPLDETGLGEAADAGVASAVTSADEAAAASAEATAASRAPVAVGEDMAGRVQPYADRVGAETYQPDPTSPESDWVQNQTDWINKVMDDGREIHDCGPSPNNANFPGITSPWYGIERAEIDRRQYPTTPVDC
jgi:hypothetical protein